MKVKPSMILIMLGVFLVVASIALPVSLSTNFMTVVTGNIHVQDSVTGAPVSGAYVVGTYQGGTGVHPYVVDYTDASGNVAFATAGDFAGWVAWAVSKDGYISQSGSGAPPATVYLVSLSSPTPTPTPTPATTPTPTTISLPPITSETKQMLLYLGLALTVVGAVWTVAIRKNINK